LNLEIRNRSLTLKRKKGDRHSPFCMVGKRGVVKKLTSIWGPQGNGWGWNPPGKG